MSESQENRNLNDMNRASAGRPRASSEGAYEIKFLLDPSVAEEIVARVRAEMQPDPHSDPRMVDGYQINSIYFDTDDLRVFRRQPGFRRRKFRIRRYGESERVFLERKAKSRGIVRKRRTEIHDTELDKVLAADSEPTWTGHWFHRRILKRELRPVCQIAYERIALVGTAQDEPIRLTVDRNLICRAAPGVAPQRMEHGEPLAHDKRILEMKFRTVLPPVFNAVVRDYQLTPGSVSKYRLGVVACGLHVGLFGEQAAEAPAEDGKDEDPTNIRSA
mgnify:CR=1 FL=1